MGLPGAIIGAAAISAGAGAYQAHRAEKAAKSQQQTWKEMTEPQKEYMRQMYPLQLEMAREYVPYYKEQIAEARKILPYTSKIFEELYYPSYEKLFKDVEEYASAGIQPWERRAISIPYQRARTKLGERAASKGMLRSGVIDKLASLYDIAEAEALATLPYQRKKEAMEYQMRTLGYQPSTPQPARPTQIGVSIPSMPAQYQPEGVDWSSLGRLMGYGLSNIGSSTHSITPSTTIQGGVGGYTQVVPGIGEVWSPYPPV